MSPPINPQLIHEMNIDAAIEALQSMRDTVPDPLAQGAQPAAFLLLRGQTSDGSGKYAISSVVIGNPSDIGTSLYSYMRNLKTADQLTHGFGWAVALCAGILENHPDRAVRKLWWKDLQTRAGKILAGQRRYRQERRN